MNITHSDLITHAAKWLSSRCAVVITDMTHAGSETPDAIGWSSRASILIECKASRADFLADRQKSFRRVPNQGMGAYRYFCTPAGLIKAGELPEGWGLLEYTEGKKSLKMAAGSRCFKEHARSIEIGLLVSALRRVGQVCPAGVSVKCYTMETKNRATLGVAA